MKIVSVVRITPSNWEPPIVGNRGELTETQLIEQTARLGFSNVIDAFHVVNQGDVPVRFFIDERRQPTRGIRLTDDLRQIRGAFQYRNLSAELEARWLSRSNIRLMV